MTTIVESQPSSAELFVGAIGTDAEIVTSIDTLRHHLESRPDEFAVVLGPTVNLQAAVHLADTLRVTRPALSVILLRPRVDTSVLAEALRSGMREVVEERDLTGLSVAVRRAQSLFKALNAERAGPAEHATGRIVTVFSAKGGVGKTTVSTNLAVALAGLGQRVCLVELDLAFGDVAISLQMFPTHNLTEVTAPTGEVGLDELRPLLTTYSDNLCALLAPATPDPGEAAARLLVGKILATLKQGFDFIVVDTPPAFDDHVLQAFDESDLLLLLLTPDIPALKNLKITLEMLELLNYSRDKCRVVLNRADAKTGLSASDVEKTLKFSIFATIPAAHEVPAAINRGEPIVTSLPRHPVSQAVLTIARDCVTAMPGPAAPAVTGGRRRRVPENSDTPSEPQTKDKKGEPQASERRHGFGRRSKTA
jgi:pilus assembly protein CpaE